jgi:hypothetical protein
MFSTKKSTLTSILLLACGFLANAQNYTSKQVSVIIFSATPVEDIKAASNVNTAVLIGQSQELVIQVPIKSLTFDKKLMQEHFNENYMESDRFPTAKFKGIISPKIDLQQDGIYAVTAKGVLSVHGVDQPRTLTGKITVKDQTISINSSFDVACVAHKIKIPSLVFTKIAEVIKVMVQGTLNQLNK